MSPDILVSMTLIGSFLLIYGFIRSLLDW